MKMKIEKIKFNIPVQGGSCVKHSFGFDQDAGVVDFMQGMLNPPELVAYA